MTDPTTDVDTVAPPTAAWLRRRGGVAVLALSALVLLLIGATAGLMLAPSDDPVDVHPTSESVDAGFLRDMSTHHKQAIKMAHLAQEHTDNTELSVFAYDMEYQQTFDIGSMQGWLRLWDLPFDTFGTAMAWMDGPDGHGGMDMAGSTTVDGITALMPGMATDEEMTKLAGLTGTASDAYFLQLMIRHHQGGGPMMTYAAEHATNPTVRQLATQMYNAQTGEISRMTDWLTNVYGQEPLPYDG